MLIRYGFAVGATSVAFLLSQTLGRLDDKHPSFFLLLFMAVLLSAWYGGFGPGVCSAILACASLESLLAFSGSPLGFSRFIVVRIAIFFPEAFLTSWFIGSRKEALLRLAALVRYSDDAISGAALDGTITSWNSGAEQIYGYSAKEMIGRRFTILVPPERAGEGQQLIARVTGGEHVRLFQTVRKRKDGRYIDVSLTISPIIAITGELIGVSVLSRDISEFKRIDQALRESEERFRTMADTAPVMIWMGDGAGNNTFCNKCMLEFTGRTQEQQLGKTWIDDIHPEDRQSCLDTIHAGLSERKACKVECRFRRADGEYRWLLITGIPRLATDGELVGYVGSCVDITERKWAELALRGSRDELQWEMEEQSTELAEATSRLIREITKRERAEDLLRDPGHSN